MYKRFLDEYIEENAELFNPALAESDFESLPKEIITEITHSFDLNTRYFFGQTAKEFVQYGNLNVGGTELINLAAEKGYLNQIQLLRKQGYDYNAGTAAIAAKNGHRDILIWTREDGCEWNSVTLLFAIKGKNNDIAKFLLDNFCYYSSGFVFAEAVLSEDMELLTMLSSRGCSFNSDAYANAAR